MNLYHKVSAQWLAYLVFFVVLAVVPLVVSDMFLLNQLATYGVFGMLALSISLCWGFGGILNLGQGIPFGLGAYGMAMTMQMQSQDAVESDAALHAQQQPRSPAGALGAVRQHRARHRAFPGGADAVLRDLRQPDVSRTGIGPVLRDHDAGDAERMVHADPRHAALHQRRQRHHAAGAPEARRFRHRSLQLRRLLAGAGAAGGRDGGGEADDAQPVRPRRAGHPQRCRARALPRLQRRRLRDGDLYRLRLHRRGRGLLLGHADPICLARAIRHHVQPVDGDLGRHRRPDVVDGVDSRRLHHPGGAELSRRHIPQHLAAGARRLLHPGGPLPAQGADRLAGERAGAPFDRFEKAAATASRPIVSSRSRANRGRSWAFSRSTTSARASTPSR